MAQIDWRIQGVTYGSCNCAYGCPCQFEALPTHGDCQGFEALRIDDGHFGDIGLGGLRTIMIYIWPGPIFEGNGTMQIIVDERADAKQRDALTKILHGEETEPFATAWYMYRSTASTVLDPLFKPIELEVNVEARTARLVVPDVIESTGEPIRSPATGDVHRARIDLPYGIEFSQAEIGSGTTKATGAMKLDHKDSYGQFAHLHTTGKGLVR
ncbi:MAG: DUF1326 domain-containing protein [Alphaproteobacteria bacterium]